MTPTTTALRRTPSLLDLAALGVAALALAACANNGDDLGGGAPAKCEFTGIRVCDARAPDLVFDVDSCGNYGTELGYTRCLGDYTDCITDENAPGGARCGCPPQVPEVLGCLPEGAQSIDNPTEIGPVDSCGYIWEVTQTCMLGERCWYHWDDGGNIVGDPFCATSIDPRHRGSEFYTMGCDIDLYMAAPTDLPMDCRCNRSNAQMQACRPAAEAWDAGLRVGAGPHTRGVNLQKWGGGFLSKERKELFAAVHYTGGQVDVKPGAVYAFNYETGDRRVVSGSYEDETGWHDVGSGDTFDGEILPFAVAAKLGADGQIYVAGSDTLNHVTIFRVDPDTGDRKLVWRRQTDAEGMDAAFPFGQCWSGRVSPNYPGGYAPVQYAERAFALAD
ncbi:MAG: hypothetical protein KC635_03100, partial [Myxococcales bacterium]|nr:hypothetical protein [Myxococcales bacterium]